MPHLKCAANIAWYSFAVFFFALSLTLFYFLIVYIALFKHPFCTYVFKMCTHGDLAASIARYTQERMKNCVCVWGKCTLIIKRNFNVHSLFVTISSAKQKIEQKSEYVLSAFILCSQNCTHHSSWCGFVNFFFWSM